MYTPADYNLSHLSYFETFRGLNGCNILWTILISLRQRALFKDLEKKFRFYIKNIFKVFTLL